MAIHIHWQAVIDGERQPNLDLVVYADAEGGKIKPETTARVLLDELFTLVRWNLYSPLYNLINNRRG